MSRCPCCGAGPDERRPECVLEAFYRLRAASADLLHEVTYDQDPRNYLASRRATIERLSRTLNEEPEQQARDNDADHIRALSLEAIVRELVAANETVDGAVGLIGARIDAEHAELLREVLES